MTTSPTKLVITPSSSPSHSDAPLSPCSLSSTSSSTIPSTTRNHKKARQQQHRHQRQHRRQHQRQRERERPLTPTGATATTTTASSSPEHDPNRTDWLPKDNGQPETVGLLTPPPSPVASPQQIDCAVDRLSAHERLLAARRASNLKNVMAELSALQRQGHALATQDYLVVIDALAMLRREGTPLTQLLQVYDTMRQTHIQSDGQIYTLMLGALCRRDTEVQTTVAMLRRQMERTGEARHQPADIAALQAEANMGRALAIFHEAVADGQVHTLKVDVLNQMLRVLSHYGDTENALEVYHYIDDAKKTAITYAALVNLFGRAGDLASALSYFEAFKQTGLVKEADHVYNAVVDAYLKCGEPEKALEMAQTIMPADGIKVTTLPYNAIIRSYCAQGQMEQAEALLTSGQFVPDASSCGPILSAYCQSDNYRGASNIYAMLITTDMSKAYGNLANYALLCLKHDQHTKALSVIQDMRRTGLVPDPVLAERIVLSTLATGDLPLAMDALRVLVEATSTRTINKASGRLVHAACCIGDASSATLADMLQVAHIISTLVPSVPVPLATRLIQVYDYSTLCDKDMQVVLEAVLVVPDKTLPVSFTRWVLDLTQSLPDVSLPSSWMARAIHRLDADCEEATHLKQQWQDALEEPPQPASLYADRASKTVLQCVTREQTQEALQILSNEIIQPGLVPSPEVMREAIALMGKQGHLQSAETMYNECVEVYRLRLGEGAQHAVYLATNSLLIGYAQQGNMVQAKIYYEQIKRMGYFPDGNAYASLLLGSANCATDEATDALTIYEEAKRHQVCPTIFFYNVLLSKLARARKLELALRLFDEMKHLFKLSPNAITYGAMISACVRAGSESHACRLFDEMLKAPYPLRIGPFNNMIQFYVRQQPDRERALAYFEELKARGIVPSSHTYKLLIEAYSMLAPYDMRKAHELIETMDKTGPRPQPTHYATLIYAYGTIQHNVSRAQQVFNQVQRRFAVMEEVVYQAMLDTLITNDQLTKAERLYNDMCQTLNKSSSPYIENLLLRGYGQKGLVDKAEMLFEQMSDDKTITSGVVVREPSTYEAMVHVYLDNNMVDKAKSVLERMQSRQFPCKVVASVAALLVA